MRLLPFLLLGVWAVVGAYIILRDPVEIGPDEGMEHAKALLVAVNPSAVGMEWNDQPWFYSYVFGVLGRANLTCMRLATLGVFIAAAGWLVAVVTSRHGFVAGFVAVGSLLSWAGVSELALSAMCEVPAMSLMMLAGLLVVSLEGQGRRAWLYCLAGVLASVALAIKLTAVLMLPFVVWLVLSAQSGGQVSSFGQRVCRRLLPFGGIALATFVLCMLPGFSLWGHVLDPHLKASAVAEARKIAPGLDDFLPASGAILFAIAGLLFMRGTVTRRLAIAAALSLLLVIVVHTFHRPFWWFYRGHFAFPVAVLAGVGASACLPTDQLRSRVGAFKMLFGLFAACLFLTTNGPVCWGDLSAQCRVSRSKDDGMLARVLSLRAHDGYGFSYRNIIVSRAGRLMPPGLTILSKKRYWTGGCKDGEVFTVVARSRPVFLLMEENQIKEQHWRQWLADGYVRTYDRGKFMLFVRKDFNPVSEVRTLDQIRAMGL